MTRYSTEEATEKFLRDMRSNTEGKSRFFLDSMSHLETASENPMIVDIGCCTGDVTDRLRNVGMPIGIDSNGAFLQLGKRYYPLDFVQAHADNLPLCSDSIDVFILSSVLHELPQPFESYVSLLSDMLKVGGLIMIRDPARPDKNDIVSLIPKNDVPLSYSDYVSTLPHDLSPRLLLLRFLEGFIPLHMDSEMYEEMTQMISYPIERQVLSEFIRHRPHAHDDHIWSYELAETYGKLLIGEVYHTAVNRGFDVVACYTDFSISHRSKGFDDDFLVYDQQGNSLTRKSDFPTHLYAILRKLNHTQS